MGIKERLDDKIKKKEQDIAEYQAKIREAQVYIQAMQDAAKLLPREEAKNSKAEAVLRPGGSAHKAFLILKDAGMPLHIIEILKRIGMINNKTNRISIGGTLARYARNSEVFMKTAPNTFALLGNTGTEEPPDDFGTVLEEEEEEK